VWLPLTVVVMEAAAAVESRVFDMLDMFPSSVGRGHTDEACKWSSPPQAADYSLGHLAVSAIIQLGMHHALLTMPSQ